MDEKRMLWPLTLCTVLCCFLFLRFVLYRDSISIQQISSRLSTHANSLLFSRSNSIQSRNLRPTSTMDQIKELEAMLPTLPASAQDEITKAINVLKSSLPQKSTGMLLCAGDKILVDALAVIDQTRRVWNSTIQVGIAHCNELSQNSINMLNSMDVISVDMCTTPTVLGMSLGDARGRLRGWFCKSAAMVLSPFDITLVADLDVVWFRNPDLLFQSPAFKKTGTLFFRDRHSHQDRRQRADQRMFQDVIADLIRTESGLNMTAELARAKSLENGYSFFWQNLADPDKPAYENFQDSSVIIIDRTTHPKTLEVLARLLPTFSVGWGDKEIYWLAATIAGEDFTFEPFLASHYGDCGLLLHYDPNDIDDPDNARPMYLNGEWLLEKISILGHDLEYDLPNPVLVNESTELFDLRTTRRCMCSHLGCKRMPRDVNEHLLRAQWERLSRRASRRGPQFDCMPMWKDSVPEISDMAIKMVERGDCPRFGCSYVPIFVNHSYDWFEMQFCDPISFDLKPSDDMLDMEKRVQEPPPPPTLTDGELVRPGSSRTVYLVVNQTLRAFPNIQTFAGMGYDFENVHVYSDRECHMMNYGPELPSF